MYEIHEEALAKLAEEYVKARRRADELEAQVAHVAEVLDESVVFPNGVTVRLTHDYVEPDYEAWAKEHVPYNARRQYIKRVVFDYAGMFRTITGFKSLLDMADPADLETKPKSGSIVVKLPA